MEIHSSVLPWKILWVEEPGRLQSMGSQRVGQHTHTVTTAVISSTQYFANDLVNYIYLK